MNDKVARVAPQEDGEQALTVAPQTAAERVQDLILALPLLAQRYEKLREVCLKHVVNRPTDWYLWGTEKNPKPRMNDGAAAKLLSFAGIKEQRISDPRKEFVGDGSKYIVFYEAKFISPLGGEFLAIGSCSSDDPFVATRKVWDEEKKRMVPKTMPQEDVAYDNVVKAARANCLVNGVSALLGLKNVEIEELKAMGLNVEKIEAVSYTSRKWEMSPSQESMLQKMGATAEQIEACASQKDIDALLTKLRAAKGGRAAERKESASSGGGSRTIEEIEQSAMALGMEAGMSNEMIEQKVEKAKTEGVKSLLALEASWAEIAKAKARG